MTNATLVFGGASLAGGALSGRRRLACALAIAAVFALDTLTPLGVGIPFLYVPIVWAALQWATHRQVMVMAAACSLLTIIDPMFFPSGVLWMAIVNRTIILMTLWFLLYFGSKYRKLVDTVQTRDRELIDFVDNAAVGMHWIGRDGTILWANQEELNMLGYNREEYVGHDIAEFHVDEPVIKDILGKLNANVPLKDYKARLRRKDGSIRDVLISSNFHRNEDRFVHARCFTRDITDRKRAEHAEQKSGELAAINSRLQAEIADREIAQAELLQAERRYRTLVESVQAVVWRADARTFQFSFVSKQAETILGYPVQRWMDEPGFWQAHVHPDDRERAVAFCVRATSELRSHDFEYRMIAADGRTVWLRDLVRVEVENGQPKELIGVMMEITGQKQVEEQLRESEELLRVTFDTAPVGINIVSREGRFLRANAAYQRMMGYTEEELRRKITFDLTHQDDLPRNRMLREELLEGRRDFFEIEKRNHTKDARLIWVRTKVSMVKDELGKPRFTVGVAQDITEQKRAEWILAESEERYRYLFESNPMPMWIRRDDTLQIVAVNDAVVRLYGYTRDELDRMTSFDLQSADHLAAYEDFVGERRADLSTLHRRGRHRKKDGSIIDVDIISHSISYAGSLARLVLAQDITERLNAETALREREELLRITFDAAPVGISIADLDGRFVRVNLAYQNMVGYSEEELRQKLNGNLTHPDDRPHFQALRQELIAGKRESFEIEKRNRIRNGELIWVRNKVSPIKDDLGKPRFTVAVCQDITERKRAEEKLRESEDRYRDLVEHSQDLICTHDLDGRILSVNPWAAKVLGYEQAELVNVNLRDVLASNVRHELDGYLAAIRTDGAAQGLMLVQPRAGEKRIWEYSNTLRTEGVSTPIVRGMAHDITERKRAERELERQAALSRLLESLAAAANKADTPEEALAACLERICAYGGWNCGDVLRIVRHGDAWRGTGTQWHFTDPRDRERFSDLVKLAGDKGLSNPGAIFINQVIRTRSARWISDLDQVRRGPRLTCAREAGVRAAFAFPVIVHDEVVACVEFFATEVREPDTALLEATGNVASHLARVIERELSGKVQAQLAAIVETSPDAIVSREIDGTILSWNQGAEKLFGYSAAETVGKKVPTVPEDRIAETQRNLDFVNAGNTLANFETERIARDGRRIQVAISAAPIVDPAGKVSGVAIITRDITERKRAERELERKTALAQLLEALARTVNEAGSPEAAMQVSLARICEHGGWVIGRLGIYAEQAEGTFPERSFWHTAEPSRYEEFIRASLDFRFYAPQGKFISVVLREKHPVWVSSISSLSGFGRMSIAVKQGLHCAFAFPVVVRDKVAAFLEFFAEETRPADPLLLENITSIAGQLARLVERNRAANANARLAAIVQNSNDAIVGRALDGIITSWNAAAERILGYTADEVVGSDLRAIFPPEQMQQIAENRKLLGMGISLPYHQAVRIAKDGRRIDVAVSVSPIKDESGRAIGTATILRDITERARAEAERSYLLNVLEASVNETYLFDAQTLRFEYVNRSGLNNLGYSLEQMRDMTPVDLKREFTEASFREMLGPLLRGEKKMHVFHTAHRRADGSSYPVEVHLQLVEHGDRQVFLAVILDVTERKRAEEERTRYLNRLRALSRRLVETQEAERRRIAAELHDRIGQNLTALTINLSIIGSQLSPAMAAAHAGRLEDSRMLVEATIETVRNVIADLRPTVLDDYGLLAALRWYGRQFEKRTGVLTTVEGQDLVPRLPSQTEAALFRITQEALNNTLKHAKARHATVTLNADAARVVLTLADDGEGFDPPVEQHGNHPGWGLLMMCERAESVGGRLRMESAPAHGTRIVAEMDRPT